ncbi:hypothetical protein [Pseudomonas sp. 5P_5.1_Bac1]|uniref:hypothetical protein n=1 Tax=Pseudomonas sp. 5P_5.1_Bac1 TaxID=2971616 RepID=UPI0021C5CDC2|nr:hypothetical protein [Pseudomonas sp. 5P_5.1_Bac1]MCU1720533.1 hypothetical protein [Pseudomonas sp. 5P_5.1_Bac1]
MVDGLSFKMDVEKFQAFIFEMDDVLEIFLMEAAAEGFSLDYSVSSLDELESYINYLDARYPEERFFSRCSRYLGEVFRKSMGGSWDLSLENSRDINFKLPVVRRFSDFDIDFSPFSVVGNYLVRRQKGLLKNAVLANSEFSKFLISPIDGGEKAGK